MLQFKKPHVILLILIITTAAFLRFYRINETSRFIWDEARDMSAIHHMITQKDLTLLGPFNQKGNQIDFFGVFHYYLMAPALWISQFDPVGPAIFTALLGVVGVVLGYALIRRWDTPSTALAVTGLYALSPLVVHYTRWAWNPNTTGFFGIVYLLALTKLHQSKNIIYSLAAGLLLGLLFQLHYFTLPLGISFVLVLLSQPPNFTSTKLKHLLGFSLSFFFGISTFILFDLTHQFFLSRIVLESIFGGGEQQLIHFSLKQLTTPITYTSSVIQGLIFGETQSVPTLKQQVVVATIATLVTIESVKQIINWLRQRTLTLSVMVAAPWLSFLLLITFFPGIHNDYHSAALWLGLWYLIIKALQSVGRLLVTKNQPTFNRKLITAVWILTLSSLIVFNHPNRPPDWDENLPLTKKLSQVIIQDAQNLNQPFSIASFMSADTRATRYRYFLTINNLTPLHHDKYPEAKVLYVITPHDQVHLRNSDVWEVQTFKEAQHQTLTTIDGTTVIKATK